MIDEATPGVLNFSSTCRTIGLAVRLQRPCGVQMTIVQNGRAATSFAGRVAKFLLFPLVSTVPALAEAEETQERRSHVMPIGYKGGYNMGPYSKYGIMKGMPVPPSGGFKWGPCNNSMLSPTFVSGWVRTPGGRYRNPAYMVRPGGVACARL
jgi:hypothetical protein